MINQTIEHWERDSKFVVTLMTAETASERPITVDLPTTLHVAVYEHDGDPTRQGLYGFRFSDSKQTLEMVSIDGEDCMMSEKLRARIWCEVTR